MSITSFDHFIETLEHVPPELQRNFTLIADLDRKTKDVIKRVHECVREYRKADKQDERIALYKESMDLFEKARSYADDKVDLAIQTYDLIDKHIRRLENLGGQATNTAETTNRASSGGRKQKDGNDNGDDQSCIHGTKPLAVDMPLDPNEPRYCTCQQVSFGEMIACDNKDCPIEWFHFACVNLKVKPKGKWYCPDCFNADRKGKLKFKRQKA